MTPDDESRSVPRDTPTLQPCAACKHCPLCHGVHLVTARQNAAYVARGERKGVEPEEPK